MFINKNEEAVNNVLAILHVVHRTLRDIEPSICRARVMGKPETRLFEFGERALEPLLIM